MSYMVYRNPPVVQQTEVVHLGSSTFPDSRKLCRSFGFSQIPLLLADNLITQKDPAITSSCWVNEVAVHPEKNRTFQRGEDIIDRKNKFRLLWADITRLCSSSEFMRCLNIALFVTPNDNFELKDEFGNTIIIPIKIDLVHGFPQESSYGVVHEKTGLVVDGNPNSETQKRCLRRRAEQSIAPIVYGSDGLGAVKTWAVCLFNEPSNYFNVVGVRDTVISSDGFGHKI